MSRNFFTILVFFFIAIIIAAGVWFLFFYQEGQRGVDIGLTIVDYLPFGRLDGPGTNIGPVGGGGGFEEEEIFNQPLKPLRQIAAGPIVGYIVNRTSTSTYTARYMERQTGNVYDVGINGEKSLRVTNTTVPRVYEAIFGELGNSVIIRYLGDDNRTIESYTAQIPKIDPEDKDGEELKGVFMEQNIADISISPDRKNIFYLSESSGGAIGIRSLTNNTNRLEIFSSPFKEWISQYPNNSSVMLNTKPSGGINGYLYKLNPTNRSFEKILGDIQGLLTLTSPDGNFIFFSSSGNFGVTSNIYDVKNSSTIPTSMGTLPDKCTWSTDSLRIYCGNPTDITRLKMPDSWYQGRVTFSDKLWVIDAPTGISEIISDLAVESGETIDVTKIFITDDNKKVFFINKRDLSLWLYEVEI